MRLKNRIIYGIYFSNISGDFPIPYINFGEGRYAYISWEDFCNKLLPTAKVVRKNQTVSLRDAVRERRFGDFMGDFQVNKFLDNYFDSFVQIEDKVVIFEKSSYLIELSRFVEHKNGKMQYVGIKQHKGYRIVFNINGTDGYSVWKGKVILETFWSIEKAKEFIDKM